MDVLLLHAGGERGSVWHPVIDRLAEFRCTAPDLRDHHTLAAHAVDVAAMATPGCILVGASLGGLAAIAALADPVVRAKVSSLVLVDVVPNLDQVRARAFLATLDIPDRHIALVADILGQVPRLSEIAASLDIPVLLARGDAGSVITDTDIDGLHRLVPQAMVRRVSGAGHLIARDRPTALAEVIAEWPALVLLQELGAARLPHPGGLLFDHLLRVRHQVALRNRSRAARLAALCHAAYGTDGFPHPLLPLTERARLRAAIGERAERLVYRYASCDRAATYPHLGESPLPFTDRFTGEVIPLGGDDLTDFALLSSVNERDVVHAIEALISRFEAYVDQRSRS
ncbi:alpha/beta hydrolase [Pseudonocardiaceae bacterium YIM PH 21723]|nr:alpha/beta hydrolase [Pseudonocardiaceae bacterium YIM PH 21723]